MFTVMLHFLFSTTADVHANLELNDDKVLLRC